MILKRIWYNTKYSDGKVPQENWQNSTKVPQENWQAKPKVPQENWQNIWRFT
jgi:hypothetical protein